ncbi:MFS transporter [Halomonas sp. S3-1-8]|nr:MULTISPECIES: MFS transporter [unclassified Halomonas]
MAEALHTGPDRIQLTLSLYMAGFALAQLLCGPISDHVGRSPVMIAGLSLFLAASILCAWAPRSSGCWSAAFYRPSAALPAQS